MLTVEWNTWLCHLARSSVRLYSCTLPWYYCVMGAMYYYCSIILTGVPYKYVHLRNLLPVAANLFRYPAATLLVHELYPCMLLHCSTVRMSKSCVAIVSAGWQLFVDACMHILRPATTIVLLNLHCESASLVAALFLVNKLLLRMACCRSDPVTAERGRYRTRRTSKKLRLCRTTVSSIIALTPGRSKPESQ